MPKKQTTEMIRERLAISQKENLSIVKEAIINSSFDLMLLDYVDNCISISEYTESTIYIKVKSVGMSYLMQLQEALEKVDSHIFRIDLNHGYIAVKTQWSEVGKEEKKVLKKLRKRHRNLVSKLPKSVRLTSTLRRNKLVKTLF